MDRYVIGEQLGRGFFGRILAARPRAGGDAVALKLLERDGPGFDAFFEAHYEVLRSVAHPNVLAALEHGEQQGKAWIATELADGETLARRLSRGPLAPRDAAPLAADMLAGLDACHQAGIVHRGLKPASLLSVRGGAVRVAGLSRAFSPRVPSLPDAQLPQDHWAYTPPEVLEGGPWTEEGDVWAAGAVLFEMLAGMPLARPGAPHDVRESVLAARGPLEDLLPGVPSKLVVVIEAALDRVPDDRPESVAELIAALEKGAPGLGWFRREPLPLPAPGTRATVIPGVAAGTHPTLVGGARFPANMMARFHPERLIGEGGTGQVWLASQIGLDRPAAIKIIHPELVPDARMIERFHQEARMVASLTHPHIVRILDYDVSDGVPWLAYEYLPGRTLRERLAEGPLEIVEAIELAIQVAEALDEAHQRGIVHRDVKPENLMEALPGVWKLIDFGIARLQGLRSLSTTGGTIGTPVYVAPELFEGRPPSPQSDMYALGVLLFEMISGLLPFDDPDLPTLLKKKTSGRAPQLHALVPEAQPLSWIVDRLLSPDPGQRFVRATDVSRFLRGLLEE